MGRKSILTIIIISLTICIVGCSGKIVAPLYESNIVTSEFASNDGERVNILSFDKCYYTPEIVEVRDYLFKNAKKLGYMHFEDIKSQVVGVTWYKSIESKWIQYINDSNVQCQLFVKAARKNLREPYVTENTTVEEFLIENKAKVNEILSIAVELGEIDIEWLFTKEQLAKGRENQKRIAAKAEQERLETELARKRANEKFLAKMSSLMSIHNASKSFDKITLNELVHRYATSQVSDPSVAYIFISSNWEILNYAGNNRYLLVNDFADINVILETKTFHKEGSQVPDMFVKAMNVVEYKTLVGLTKRALFVKEIQ